MTIESPPLWLQGGAYPARLDRQALAEMREEGVANALACKVTQRGAGANFSVDIDLGRFWIEGDDEVDQGVYQARITAIENAAISGAPSGSDQRYDIVTLLVQDPNAGGDTGDTVVVAIVEGTEATTPVVPTLPASSLPIAVIGPITSATSSITDSIIHDAWSGTGPAFAASCRLLAGDRVPVGEMRLRAANPDRVNGWLHCNGQAVSRSTYDALFAEIGTAYGVGDGSTTFNVPDLRDRVPVAKGTTFGSNGATGGEVNHTLTQSEMPNHNHGGTTGNQSADHTHTVSGSTGTTGAHTHEVKDGLNYYAEAFSNYEYSTPPKTNAFGQSAGAGNQLTARSSGDHAHSFSGTTGNVSANHTHTISSQGSGTAHNNMQPYVVVGGWMIKAT